MAEGRLAGIGVLLTRPEHQADELARTIEAHGGRVYRFPVIDILPRDPAAVAADAAALTPADIVVYVSANAVRHGRAALTGSTANTSATTAAIGPATALAIEADGGTVDVVPSGGYASEHLLAVDEMRDLSGKTITIVRGDSGRELLAETLRHRGATVQYLSAYRREPHEFTQAELDRVERDWGKIDAVIVMSVASLDYLLDALPDACVEALPAARLVAPSERVIQTAKGRLPGANVVLAPSPTAADLVDALANSLTENPDSER